MYTIKRAAELTGVPVATLRAWERRYDVVTPHRTDSGYRLYDDEALATLTAMNTLVHEGWTPSQAAGEVRRRRAVDDAQAPPLAMAAGPVVGSAPQPGPPEQPESPAQPGSAAEPGSLASLTLVDPAMHLDGEAVTRILDDAFSRASFEVVVDSWLMPALRDLGTAWSDGRVTVAGEHLVAYAVQRRLAAAFEAAGGPVGGPRVVVGLPAGSRHELGLLAFAVAARRAGLETVYVGADLPAPEWAQAVARHRADAAVLAASTPADLDHLHAVVSELRAVAEQPQDGLLIAVGGGQQDAAPQDCLRLGHRIGDASRRLARALNHRR